MTTNVVRLILYDIDGHSLNCHCGLCGANKKSYGVAIFPPDQLSDPIEVVYGPSEPAAFHNGRLYCREHDMQILDDIVQNPDGSHTGHPTVEFAESTCRIYCPVGHIVSEVSLDDWAGSEAETNMNDPAYTVTCAQS